jgi:hypothetical protein
MLIFWMIKKLGNVDILQVSLLVFSKLVTRPQKRMQQET